MSRTDTAPSELRTSRALAKVGPSAISRVGAEVAALTAAGRRLADLHQGEPDFRTPEHVSEAAIRAIRAGDTHYTALAGTPALRAAIRGKFARENGLDFADNEVVTGTGAKHLIFAAFFATIGPGDEVVIPAPFWGSYVDIVEMMGATPVVVPTRAEDGFLLRAADLEAAITPRTRWLLLNSPSNPTGAVYEADDYLPILEVLARNPQVWLMADDIYEHVVYDGTAFVTPLQLRPDLRDRTFTLNGVSKTYAMTGWRIGYGAGPAALIGAILPVLSQSTSSACSIAQAAAAAALAGPQDVVEAYRLEYQARRDLVMARLRAIPASTCIEPKGAFYAFIGWTSLVGSRTSDGAVVETDEQFCRYLLHEHGLAVIPGSAFGAPGHVRISFASASAVLEDAMMRLAAACAALS